MGLRVALAVSVLAAAAGVAVADPAAEAKAHREQGLRRYNTQDYEGAIKEWRQAYVLAPDPDTLFAIGQAQRLMGDCKAAVVTYRTALRDVSGGKQRVEIEQVIKVCEDKLAAEPPKPAEPVTPPEARVEPAQ